MPPTLDDNTILRLRMRAQGLADPRAESVRDVLHRVGALQAQDLAASQLALHARAAHLTIAAVTRACNQDRVVVRTWLMRGTLHMVAAEDVRWLLRPARPHLPRQRPPPSPPTGIRRRPLRPRAPRDPRDPQRWRRAHPRRVSGRARHERHRHRPQDAGARAPRRLRRAQRTICRGPDRADGEPTYVLLDEWIDPARDQRPDDRSAALARLYLTSYGPATADDLAAWAGISLTAARQSIERTGGFSPDGQSSAAS